MSNEVKIINYGAKDIQDFPNPDEVRKELKNGDVAYIKDKTTMYEYVLTNQFCGWSRIDTTPATKHMEKVYEVEFMEYTNCMRDTVSNQARKIGDMKYISVGKEPFLVRESELEKYMAWGKGFRIIRFVGNIVI